MRRQAEERELAEKTCCVELRRVRMGRLVLLLGLGLGMALARLPLTGAKALQALQFWALLWAATLIGWC